jgi:SAM-dependent methyltransferase
VSEHEVDLIVARLRDELGAGADGEAGDGASGFHWARAQAERFWAITADRPFLYKPGTRGQIRGMLLVPIKVLLAKLIRWYVEPAFAQQREFNSSVLKALDQLNERADQARSEFARAREDAAEILVAVNTLQRSAAEADERLLRVERRVRRGDGLAANVSSQTPEPGLAAAAELPDYFAFEARMRGSRELIRERQAPYVDEFRDRSPVLDIGCGRGEFLELLRDAGVEARGIDLDADMVEHCREEGLDVQRAEAVAYLPTLGDGSLGGIFCAHVVEHLAPPALFRLLELAAAKLRQRGLFVAETPNPLSLYALANFTSDLSHDKPLHPATLEFLARQAGFRETELRFLSEPPDPERLRRVPLPSERTFDQAREALDANVARLNDVVFGPQDYAVFART